MASVDIHERRYSGCGKEYEAPVSEEQTFLGRGRRTSMIEHWEVLPDTTAQTWSFLGDLSVVDPFYLAGGTGLALQIGHRISRDLDFFTEHHFEVDDLVQRLGSLGRFQLEMKEAQTIVGVLHETKLSFLGYPYPLLESPIGMRDIRIAGISDIACMKIDAISSRGTKRDFIDLFFILQTLSFEESIRLFQTKYATIGYNLMHIKKSLVYFDDADPDPMPDMLATVDWDHVKAFFLREVSKLI